MPLEKPWRELTRETVAQAPDAPGVYELGTDGEISTLDYGILRGELKSALLYSDATHVRWERTHTPEQAASRYETHSRRLDSR